MKRSALLDLHGTLEGMPGPDPTKLIVPSPKLSMPIGELGASALDQASKQKSPSAAQQWCEKGVWAHEDWQQWAVFQQFCESNKTARHQACQEKFSAFFRAVQTPDQLDITTVQAPSWGQR